MSGLSWGTRAIAGARDACVAAAWHAAENSLQRVLLARALLHMVFASHTFDERRVNPASRSHACGSQQISAACSASAWVAPHVVCQPYVLERGRRATEREGLERAALALPRSRSSWGGGLCGSPFLDAARPAAVRPQQQRQPQQQQHEQQQQLQQQRKQRLPCRLLDSVKILSQKITQQHATTWRKR